MSDLLDRLAELEAAATSGPWWYDGRDIFRVPFQNNGRNLIVPLPETWHESQEVNKADAEFIAASRAAMPALIAVARAASDPFLVLLESHPNCDPPANEEMRRAADRLREALAALDGGAA